MTQPAAQDDVKATLTPDSTVDSTTGGRPAASTRPRRRRRSGVENTDYAAFAARVIRAHARRVADGDVDALADLLRLAVEVDTGDPDRRHWPARIRVLVGRDRRPPRHHPASRTAAMGEGARWATGDRRDASFDHCVT